MSTKRLIIFTLIFIFLGAVGLYIAHAQQPSWQELKEKSPNLDSDNDGMPDWWELKYGLNPNSPYDANIDIDGDKVKNIEEYKLGTDPRVKEDKDGNGLPDAWELKYFGKIGVDPNADPDNDGIPNIKEFELNTDPTKPDKVEEGEEVVSRQTHPVVKAEEVGVKPNVDPSIPADHIVARGKLPHQVKIVFRDPIGDDKGPGYYTYPTDPVYVPGGFDITEVEIDALDENKITIKVSVNANLKQEWGMAADFDIQHVQVYIDQDRLPGSGYVKSIPGLNVYFAPDQAWEKAIIISPQPYSRVKMEVEAKASDMKNDIVIPRVIKGIGRTIIAVVDKRELDIEKDTDITKWGWQFIMQSNEGFPDAEDVLTRNVNEYRGQHRWGGGSDYWGDPEFVDMLVAPALGYVKEAQAQFDILNVWESYPDPTEDVKAVVPMVYLDQTEPWQPAEGYKKFAVNLSKMMKPPRPADKYVSGNFDLYGKLFTRWNWNLDPNQENMIRNSLEIGIDTKVFTKTVDLYLRFELLNWDATSWLNWQNSTPGQVALGIQSRKVMLVNPLPTLNLLTIGNLEISYSAWTIGRPWYPDRDKRMGIMGDGSMDPYFSYSFAIFYPMQWIGFEWSKGSFSLYDLAYGLKLSSSYIPGTKINASGDIYTDFELSPQTKEGEPKKTLLRGYNYAVEADGEVKLPLGFSMSFLGALSQVKINDQLLKLEEGMELDIDGNKLIGQINKTGINEATNTTGYAFTLSLKNDNMLDTGLGFTAQGFYIHHGYNSFMAARGDTTALMGGFGGGSTAGTADALIMVGNQSVHRAPQAADFVGSVPIPPVPSELLIPDPVTSTKGIGWINDSWEGVTAMGWQGGTLRFDYSYQNLRAQLEGNYITFNNPSIIETNTTKITNNSDLALVTFSVPVGYENYRKIRGYFALNYNLYTILKGIEISPNVKFELNQIANTNTGASSPKFIGNLLYVLNKWYISPMLTVGIQWIDIFKTTIGYKFEYGFLSRYLHFYNASLNLKANQLDNPLKEWKRNRIILTAELSLPIGYYKLRGEYWWEPDIKEELQFESRMKYGAYAVVEWEYSF